MEEQSPSRMKQGFAACVAIGVALIAGFVVFQEWGNREWSEEMVPEAELRSQGTGAGEEQESRGEKITPPARPVLTFLFWNVHNYGVAGENGLIPGMNNPKKKEEAEALVSVLAGQRADVLALVEVNSRLALEDLRGRLKERGLDYSYEEFIKREGQMRGMALLSRFPLIGKDSRANVPLGNVEEVMPGQGVSACMMRGILSVTVDCPGGLLNVGIVHFKSRVGEQAGSEGLVRRAEAGRAREWAMEKRKSSPATPLILCGDFNDTPDSPAIRSLLTGQESGIPLRRLAARDSRGETWTHYYRAAETYSLFDYVFYSPASRKSFRLSASLVDDSLVRKASDHRPVIVKINKS